ncbi:type IV pilus assembly protein PilM [Euzebya sp.]|uniref:type IV pilus assembly protein PilM n=1 Tax=Euzebya sp. TaxID=1971409 RepID=UPI003517A770
MATAIGLDIGSSAVRAIQLSRRKDVVTLDRLGQVVLPAQAVIDGEIRDPAAITEAIGILWDQFGFKSKKVALGLANQHVIVRRVDLPHLDVPDMKESLRFQAQDYLPLPIEQIEFDYEYIEEFTHEDGSTMMRVLFVAAEKHMVASVLDVAKAARLRPVALDLDAFAAMRSLRTPLHGAERFGAGDTSGELIVDLGSQLTNLVVHSDGVPRFARIINIGGDDITESLVSAFGMEWQQAETLKSVTPGASSQYSTLLDDRISWLVEEIRNSMTYYRAAPGAIDVQRVVLTGGSSLIPGIDERISRALAAEAVTGKPFRGLHIGKDLTFTDDELEAAQTFFAVAVGLAMRGLE